MNGHHATLGGLLLHLFEVTSIARSTAKTMNANVDLVVAEIVHRADEASAKANDMLKSLEECEAFAPCK